MIISLPLCVTFVPSEGLHFNRSTTIDAGAFLLQITRCNGILRSEFDNAVKLRQNYPQTSNFLTNITAPSAFATMYARFQNYRLTALNLNSWYSLMYPFTLHMHVLCITGRPVYTIRVIVNTQQRP